MFVPECLAGELLRELEVPLELATAQAGRQDPRKRQAARHRGEQGPDVSFLQVANIKKNKQIVMKSTQIISLNKYLRNGQKGFIFPFFYYEH